jgi:Mg2+ and Co2+ transporter CorA
MIRTKYHYFIVSDMLYKGGHRRIALEQLSIFLGKSYVITIQEEHDVFEQVRSRMCVGRKNWL